jgi:hypothetical protein
MLALTFGLAPGRATAGPNPADIFNEIAVAFRAGNASEVSKYFGGRVEVKINQKDDIYSKAQAEQILSDFFNRHKPASFNIIHRGSSQKGAKYAIGELDTNRGAYRAYFYLKSVNGSYLLQEIRLEAE